jgi:AraC-like DNA-binding protein
MAGNWEQEAVSDFGRARMPGARDVLIQTFPPDLPGTFWVHVVNHSKLFQMHHEMYMIALMHRGGGRWICDGREGGMTAGEVAFFEPGQFHRVFSLDGPPGRVPRTTQDVVVVDGAQIRRALEERGIPPMGRHLRANTFSDPLLRCALGGLIRSLHPGHERLQRESALAAVVNLMADRVLERGAPRISRHRRAVARAREIIRWRFQERLSLDEVAAAAGVSKYHLVRAFAREVGTTPHDYLTEVRITHTRRLLSRGVPPSHAAVEAGFFDQSHFIRAYRRTFGVPPVRGTPWA